MKKVIAFMLSVLVLISAVGAVFAFAEDGDDPAPVESYTIVFVDYDDSPIKTLTVSRGQIVKAPENPTREGTEDIEYVFKGWSADGGQTLYHAGTLPVATESVTYKAYYSEQEIVHYQTFWNFIQSIFARINAIFEYFYRIFTRN